MLSFDGWSVGIAYTSKVVLDIVWFIFIIYKLRKRKIVFLYYPAITMITFAFAYILFMADFINILTTGKNLQIINLSLLYFLTLIYIGIVSFGSVGIILTFPKNKKLLIIGFTFYTIILYIIAFFLPNFGFSLLSPSNSGENLHRLYIQFNSIMFYLYIPFPVLAFFVAINFLLKSVKLKGRIRRKYISLTSGYFFSCIWLYFAFLSPNFGIVFAVIFTILNFLVWSTLYYGLTPIKERKSKKKAKKTPGDAELKFVSYLTDKKSLEGDVGSDDNLRDILVFISYSTKDSKIYKIQDIAEKLKEYQGIKDVLFYEGEAFDNIIKYMNDNLGECDAFLLFCSQNALSSVPVEKEWTAAEAMGVPIIPIFFDLKHVPPLLQSRLGVEYDFYNINQTVRDIYSTIVKKCAEMD